MTDQYQKLRTSIQNVNETTFEQTAIELFRFQAQHNPLYNHFIELLGISIGNITKLSQIPFLPISFFKFHTIKTQDWPTKTIFKSSGTTSAAAARHHLRDEDWYRHLAIDAFEAQYGSLSDVVVLGLLPSYLERGASSLVYMVQQFMDKTTDKSSGFFLHDFEQLAKTIRICQEQNKKVLLIGVTYALLDFAAEYPMDMSNVIVMETGGMKGRRQEWTKAKVHEVLQAAFGGVAIHSEYGMTELLSQAYAPQNGVFQPSRTMHILIREANDPFCMLPVGRSGGINIIDLANIDTCAFIATDDLGRKVNAQEFEVLGRLSASDMRGCNLLLGEF